MAEQYKAWDLIQDPKSKDYYFLDPNLNKWEKILAPGLTITDEVAKQAVEFRKANPVHPTPGPAETQMAAGLAGPEAKPLTPTSALERLTRSPKALAAVEELGKGALITAAGFAPELLAGTAAAKALGPVVQRVLRSSLASGATAGTTQYALEPEAGPVGPALTAGIAAGAPAIVRAGRAMRQMPVEEIAAIRRGEVRGTQQELGKFLQGEEKGMTVRTNRGEFQFAPHETADDIFARMGNKPVDVTISLLELDALQRRMGVPTVINPQRLEDALMFGGRMSVQDVKLLRQDLVQTAHGFSKAKDPLARNMPLARELNNIVKLIDNSMESQFPDWSRALAAHHREQSVGKFRALLETPVTESSGPLQKFREQRARGVIEEPSGRLRSRSDSIEFKAFTEAELDDIERTIAGLENFDRKFTGMATQGRFTRMKGAAVGALIGAPLGHPWLGIHLGRETSNVISNWVTNKTRREMVKRGLQKGVLGTPGFYVAMTALTRGSVNVADRIMNELPDNPDMAVDIAK